MTMAAVSELKLHVQDVTGQKARMMSGIKPDATVGQLIDDVLAKMALPETDSDGRPISYFGRLEREGRQLHRTEILGDAVQTDDRITLMPNVEAGGSRRA